MAKESNIKQEAFPTGQYSHNLSKVCNSKELW